MKNPRETIAEDNVKGLNSPRHGKTTGKMAV
jgi:hypothetical protein